MSWSNSVTKGWEGAKNTNALTNYFTPIRDDFHDREAPICRMGFRTVCFSYLDFYESANPMAHMFHTVILKLVLLSAQGFWVPR
jgi:hypothetical protein